MVTNQQLSFLQEKITELESAIFFNLSDSVLKLPTSIVSTLKVDDYGYVWFFVSKPKQELGQFEKEFPVRLDFFKKGKPYFLQVSGKGWVVTDPEEMSAILEYPEVKQKISKDMVPVKVKILKAEYQETRSSEQTTWWQNAMNTVSTWFRGTNDFHPGNTLSPAS